MAVNKNKQTNKKGKKRRKEFVNAVLVIEENLLVKYVIINMKTCHISHTHNYTQSCNRSCVITVLFHFSKVTHNQQLLGLSCYW